MNKNIDFIKLVCKENEKEADIESQSPFPKGKGLNREV